MLEKILANLTPLLFSSLSTFIVLILSSIMILGKIFGVNFYVVLVLHQQGILIASSAKKKYVLIVGPMESGKTNLFQKLKNHFQNIKDLPVQTVCSSMENVFGLFVDVPGHPKLSSNIIRKYANAASSLSLIVCIDVSALATGLKSSSR